MLHAAGAVLQVAVEHEVAGASGLAALYRNNGEWKFNAIGSGYQGGLAALCANYGVDVE